MDVAPDLADLDASRLSLLWENLVTFDLEPGIPQGYLCLQRTWMIAASSTYLVCETSFWIWYNLYIIRKSLLCLYEMYDSLMYNFAKFLTDYALIRLI